VEAVGAPIVLTFRREFNEVIAFRADFSISGTALPSDFVVTGATSWDPTTGKGSVAFAQDELTRLVTLTPVADGNIEGTETVVVQVDPSSEYIASAVSATEQVIDGESNSPPEIQLVWPQVPAIVTEKPPVWVEVRASDDDFGGSTLTYGWSQVSGPGTAAFDSSASAGTSVTFDLPGVYQLRCVVSDGTLSSNIDVQVQLLAASIEAGISEHWRLNEGAGTVVTDSSGNGAGGNTAAGWSASAAGSTGLVGDYAASFDSSQPSQIIGTAAAPLSAFTLSVWVRPTSVGVDNGIFSTSASEPGIELRYDAAGWFTGQLTGAQPSNVIRARLTFPLGQDTLELFVDSSPNSQVAEQWQHLVLSWANGRAPRLFINGVEDRGIVFGTRVGQDNSTIASGEVVSRDLTSVRSLILGGALGNWDGLIDEFRFYRRELTQAEIQTLYTNAQYERALQATVTIPSSAYTHTPLPLSGSVTDTDSPHRVTVAWRQMSGPGVATFVDSSTLETTVEFNAPGNYVLALVVNDGQFAAGQEASISVRDRAYDQSYVSTLFSTHPEGTSGPHTEFSARGNGILSNGEIFAYGIDSLAPQDADGMLPSVHLTNSYLELSFRRLRGGTGDAVSGYTAGGITYTAEVSNTLEKGTWRTGSDYLEQTGQTVEHGDGTETVTIRSKQTIDQTGVQQFLRLRLSQ